MSQRAPSISANRGAPYWHLCSRRFVHRSSCSATWSSDEMTRMPSSASGVILAIWSFLISIPADLRNVEQEAFRAGVLELHLLAAGRAHAQGVVDVVARRSADG